MKVGFVLLSSSRKPQPSTRVAVLNMLPFLLSAGIQAELALDPDRDSEQPNLDGLAQRLISQKFDCIFFQKVRGSSVQACVSELSKAGIATIYSVCDLVDEEMTRLVDLTLVPTKFLRSLYPYHLQNKIRVVHDGIEFPEEQKLDWGSHFGSRKHPLRAVLVTSSSPHSLPVLVSPPSWLTVSIIGRYPPASDWKQKYIESRWAFSEMQSMQERLAYIKFLANRRIRTDMWEANSVYSAMREADIGIIPIEPTSDLAPGTSIPLWKVKSENRLTLKMAIGLPVIATPIPSYEKVIESGKNGFLAHSHADWLHYLEILRDPVARSKIGTLGRTSVIERYSMPAQAHILIEALQALSYRAASPKIIDI